jgi:hypothetical protein
MKTVFAIWLSLLTIGVSAQADQRSNMNLPIIISVQFHSISVPFHHMKSNFRNIGIGIGTELDYSNESKFHQRFSLVYYHNKAAGNGWLLQSQALWRPSIGSEGFGELNAGLGYMITKRPVESYKFSNGDWVPAGKKGKGLLIVPVGIGGGYVTDNLRQQMNHFFNYEMMLVTGYNRSIPIVPETLIQFGSSIKNK